MNPFPSRQRNAFGERRPLHIRQLLLIGAILSAGLLMQPASAAVFHLFGIKGDFNLDGTYSYAVRLQNPSDGIINASPDPEIPIPKSFKYPRGYQYDDGDRSFEKWDTVNNRATLFSQLELHLNDHVKLHFSGDAFYDRVYRSKNNYHSQDPNIGYVPPNWKDGYTDKTDPHHFPSATRHYNGLRARLLDAFVGMFFYIGDKSSLNIKLGKTVTAWGQSLFFSGVALAQSPADATKATVPGAKVKSILLPTEQVSFRYRINQKFTVVGQWKFRYKHTELNPDGGFYSPADVVAPGAKFAYGIKNPLNFDILSQLQASKPQMVTDLLDKLLLGQPDGKGTLTTVLKGLGVNQGLLNGLGLGGLLDTLVDQLANLSPITNQALGVVKGLNPTRRPDINGDRWTFNQWGIGLEYNLNFTTQLGFYHLNYNDTNPAPTFDFGYLPLLNIPGGPTITTQAIDAKVPVHYAVKYFNDVKLNAMSFSTVAFGANIGGEFIYRRGIDVLVNVDEGIDGPVPTPTRADAYQVLLNGIYVFGPGPYSLWDSMNLVGALGYIYVGHIHPLKTHNPGRTKVAGKAYYNELYFDRDAAAFSLRMNFAKRAIFPGWDLNVQPSFQGQFYNHAAVAGAFGSLMGQGDYRMGLSIGFTRLQKLTLALHYMGFFGSGDFKDRPLADRDSLAFTASYQFF